MAEYTCRKPCVYLVILGVAIVTTLTIGVPIWRSQAARIERHDVQIERLESMQDTLDAHTKALERLAVSVEYIARQLRQPVLAD